MPAHPFDAIPLGAQVTVHPKPTACGGGDEAFRATWGGYCLGDELGTGRPVPEEMYVVLTDPADGPALYPAASKAGAPLTYAWYDLRGIEYGGSFLNPAIPEGWDPVRGTAG